MSNDKITILTEKDLFVNDDMVFIQHTIIEHKCDICNQYCNDYSSFKINNKIFNGHKQCYLKLLNCH